jgi:hypothetical protein
MSLPAPLPIPPEELVIVEVGEDGYAVTELVHLPAARIVATGAGGPTFDRYDFPPSTWPSACRELKSGFVYVRAGMLTDAPICHACEEAA